MIENVVVRFFNVHLVIGEDGYSSPVYMLVVPDEHQLEHGESCQVPGLTCIKHLQLDAFFEVEYTRHVAGSRVCSEEVRNDIAASDVQVEVVTIGCESNKRRSKAVFCFHLVDEFMVVDSHSLTISFSKRQETTGQADDFLRVNSNGR